MAPMAAARGGLPWISGCLASLAAVWLPRLAAQSVSENLCEFYNVTCPLRDSCDIEGVCINETGLCNYTVEADGVVCDDGRNDTYNDTCGLLVPGSCRGYDPTACHHIACPEGAQLKANSSEIFCFPTGSNRSCDAFSHRILCCDFPVYQMERDDQLLNAAALSDAKRLDGLVSMRADLSARDWGGSTALHLAALHGHARIVRRLIEGRSTLGARDQMGWAPLHVAAGRGHAATVTSLLAARADPGAQTGDYPSKDSPEESTCPGCSRDIVHPTGENARDIAERVYAVGAARRPRRKPQEDVVAILDVALRKWAQEQHMARRVPAPVAGPPPHNSSSWPPGNGSVEHWNHSLEL